jgi:hypothetical protein
VPFTIDKIARDGAAHDAKPDIPTVLSMRGLSAEFD